MECLGQGFLIISEIVWLKWQGQIVKLLSNADCLAKVTDKDFFSRGYMVWKCLAICFPYQVVGVSFLSISLFLIISNEIIMDQRKREIFKEKKGGVRWCCKEGLEKLLWLGWKIWLLRRKFSGGECKTCLS